MIGTLDPGIRQVTVVGAGFSGLLAAYRLDRAGYEVTLLEASQRVGGMIRTVQTRYGISESAAHSIMANADVLELCRELSVELAHVRADSRRRYILRGGQLSRFPLTAGETLKALARAAGARAPQDPDAIRRMTLDEWGRLYLGEAAVDYLLSPFVTGIYAARPSELLIDAAFPSLAVPAGKRFLLSRLFGPRAEASRNARGGPSVMVAPKFGMGDLIAKLETHLKTRLVGRFDLDARIGRLPDTTNLVLCVPAHAAVELFEEREPVLADALAHVTYSPLVSVTAFLPNAAFKRQPRGVGVLFPELEKRRSLGILFNSSAFEGRVALEDAYTSFTVMLGGSVRPELVDAADDRLRSIVDEELRQVLGSTKSPSHCEIHRWHRAIPRYDHALERMWRAAREGWCARPGHVLFGNYTGSVSLRGMIGDSKQLPGPRP